MWCRVHPFGTECVMDLTEWIISVALILVVVRQIRGRKLTLIGLLWPVPLVAWGAINYLGGVPAYAADWTFVAVDCAAGLALGVGCGLLTDVYIEDGVVKARARWLAAVLWIVGMSSRLAFGLFATNGGAEKIGELSEKLGIHSAPDWISTGSTSGASRRTRPRTGSSTISAPQIAARSRRSPPRRCSRKLRASSASPLARPCRWRRNCTKAWRWARKARSA